MSRFAIWGGERERERERERARSFFRDRGRRELGSDARRNAWKLDSTRTVDVTGGEDRMHHCRANYDALADLSALILLGTSHKIDRCLTRRLSRTINRYSMHTRNANDFHPGYDEGDNVPGDRLIRQFTWKKHYCVSSSR